MRIFKNMLFAAAVLAFTAGMTTGCSKKGQTEPTTPAATDGADEGGDPCAAADPCAAPDQPDADADADAAANPDGAW